MDNCSKVNMFAILMSLQLMKGKNKEKKWIMFQSESSCHLNEELCNHERYTDPCVE